MYIYNSPCVGWLVGGEPAGHACLYIYIYIYIYTYIYIEYHASQAGSHLDTPATVGLAMGGIYI